MTLYLHNKKLKNTTTMKKTLLFVSLAALAATGLSSCADDEPIDSRSAAGESISFRPAMAGQTRATETTNDNLSSIFVTSFMAGKKYFNDVEFSKGTDGFFTSTDSYKWPGDDTQLSFFAYSPSMNDLGSEVVITDDNSLQLQSYVTPEEIADQKDFITANATGIRSENEENGVELTFSHRLAQIEIRAITNNEKYVYTVAGARIGRPETTGTFDFNTNEWTLDSWHETGIYNTSITPVALSSTSVSLMGDAGNAMLIPQTLTGWSPISDPDNVARHAYLSVLINISTKDGVQMYPFPSDTMKDANGNPRKYAWASIPLTGTWEQGKKYIYTLDFTDGAGNVDPDDPNPGTPVLGKDIKFTVKVLDWTDAESTIPMTATYKE